MKKPEVENLVTLALLKCPVHGAEGMLVQFTLNEDTLDWTHQGCQIPTPPPPQKKSQM
jgi:hypothetical protein